MPSANVLVGNVPSDGDTDRVRELARDGVLAKHAATLAGAEYARLSGGAYRIVWPVVFERLTRRLEHRRGHHRCALSVRHLEPDCLDRFHEDVEAVLDDLLRNAKVPILNLEGWITGRLNAATVNGYRRRRGERGALQRPRLPKWLSAALGPDPWLSALAVDLLVWVGLPVTAGTNVWPWSAWAERRCAVTGASTSSTAQVARDVDVVLAAIRRNRAWYEKFVERPLDRKPSPLAPQDGTDPDWAREHPLLTLAPRHETDDARLLELASLAVTAIETRLRLGEEPRTAVVRVLRTVFGSGTGAAGIDALPDSGPTGEERVISLLADEEALGRILSQVLDIVAS